MTGAVLGADAVPGKRSGTEVDASGPQRARSGQSWKGLLSAGAVAMAVWYGWQRRGDVYLAPDQGPGYALGIIGASLMLLLLLYPLRKHAAWMRRFGHVRHWFRMHMLMGVIGPVCILYHCNFQLGSLNGNVALFSMLVVSLSGLVGRYLYTRVHYGLYGSKVELAQLGGDAAALRENMQELFVVLPGMREMLYGLERDTLRLPHSLAGSIAHALSVALKSRLLAWRIVRTFRHGGRDNARLQALLRRYLQDYMATIRRVAGFTFYERLFSLWHLLHLPLFVMLLVSGVVHVIAVHVY